MYDQELYDTVSEFGPDGAELVRPAVRPCNCGAQAYPQLVPSAYPDARALDYNTACSDARAALVALGCSTCGTMTCAQLAAKIANDCTIFVGNDPIRCAMSPGSCGSVCTGGSTPPGGGDNTMLILGLAGIAAIGVIGAVMISKSGQKKILVAKTS